MPYKLDKFVRPNGTTVTHSYWEPFPNAPSNLRQSEIFTEEPDLSKFDFQTTDPLVKEPADYKPVDYNKKLFPYLKD